MKRHMFVLLAASGLVPCTFAQNWLQRSLETRPKAPCAEVRPGDTVHYSLTILNAGDAKSVYADLRLRPTRNTFPENLTLTNTDFRAFPANAYGTRDPQQPELYHFTFKVPRELAGGIYRGAGVSVALQDRPAFGAEERKPDVTRETQKEVRAYCLNVINVPVVEKRPVVTSFQPGEIESK